MISEHRSRRLQHLSDPSRRHALWWQERARVSEALDGMRNAPPETGLPHATHKDSPQGEPFYYPPRDTGSYAEARSILKVSPQRYCLDAAHQLDDQMGGSQREVGVQ